MPNSSRNISSSPETETPPQETAVHNMAYQIWDKVPESILIAEKLLGKIKHVNVHFRNRIMNFGDINSLFFVQDLVRERDRAAVRDCMEAAVAAAAAAGSSSSTGAAVQDVDCDILVLSPTNEFPLYTKCHVQLSVDGADIVMSVRPRHVPREGCACNAAAPVTTSNSDAPASANNVDDVQDYVNNAPIALQFLSASGHVLWTNKVTLDLLGYEASEFIGKHITEFSCDDESMLQKNFAALNRGEEMHNYASKWRTKTGEIRHVLIDSNIHRGKDGGIRNTRCFIRDDTARQIQQARSEVENTAALEKMSAQDKFLRKVLHEIRTPCNVIMQGLDLAETRDAAVHTQMMRLLRIVKDVEDADTFESGKSLVLRSTRFHLLNLVHEVFAAACEEFPTSDDSVERGVVYLNGIDIEANQQQQPQLQPEEDATAAALAAALAECRKPPAELPAEVQGDPQCLIRVLTHLVENAMRFTSSGYVRLELGYANGKVLFSVANTGPKLDKDMMHRVCQRYWESGKSTDADGSDSALFGGGEGIGLGLNISFNILQCMGASLVMSSENGVNRFTFTLQPEVHSTVMSDDYTPPESTLNGEAQTFVRRPSWSCPTKWVPVQESENSKAHIVDSAVPLPPPPPATATTSCELGRQAPRRPHILVVDDNTICQKVLCRTLKAIDCTTAVANNGQVACDMVKADGANYDLVFLDLRMPVMSGIDAAAIMTTEGGGIRAPIIAFSADTTQEIREKCQEVGMKDFVSKPATQQTIRDLVMTYCPGLRQ